MVLVNGYLELADLITNTGFPIAMALLMGWYIKYQSDSTTKTIQLYHDSLMNNTRVMEKLAERIDRISDLLLAERGELDADE